MYIVKLHKSEKSDISVKLMTVELFIECNYLWEEYLARIIPFAKKSTTLVIYAAPLNSFVRVQCNADHSKITPIGIKGNVVCTKKHFRTKRNYASDCRVRKWQRTTDERLINSYREWENGKRTRTNEKTERED